MTSTLERPAPPRPDRSLARAWMAVLLIPVTFFAVFALSYVAYDLFGYAPEDNDVPLWLDIVVSVLGVVIFAVPCAAAVVFGRRADRAGGHRGLVPAVLGVVAGVGLTVLTLVTLIDAHVG